MIYTINQMHVPKTNSNTCNIMTNKNSLRISKGVIRPHKSKKDRHHNVKMKKDKTLHRKLMIEQHEPH
jgi:hypothetical protein